VMFSSLCNGLHAGGCDRKEKFESTTLQVERKLRTVILAGVR